MNTWNKRPEAQTRAQEVLQARMMVRLQTLNSDQLALILEFTEQIVACFDPDAISDFLHWRSDPKLGTVLQLAAALDDEALDQLLFHAEEYYQEEERARA